ncbi:maltose alpha-D-glucosyltransferase [Leptothermofonsia sichuanensis E412]|nr:maltose alpha-D-glucosyltransferase [Leptothermofonsia sichuanensis]QZZ22978.1 maltose alpha-D-glucosyltransferase [Leptothermofonsia sichuanensis E412]
MGISLQNDALWFKNALIYEVPVRAFADSNGDGIGDFKGLTGKLGYLQDLGITAVWILPFFPSPLRDDGYDIADYTNVNPIYGTLDDFKEFLEAAHQRGIRVIIELIVNHTSDQHPWFQRARKAPKGSPERDFYVWSDTPDKYRETRIIFQDFESSNWTWDPLAQSYYWHRFYAHQPDLNYDNPAVRQAVFEVLDFWLSMGVDGLRMDAVPYLYEREGTNCENLPETHAFLKQMRRYVDDRYPNRMLLAEANQWPEDAAAYYGDGDECHMNFHFPLMPRLFMALRMEDNFPIVDILQQTPPIPDNCQWGLFLRNHDELTLEMVTDEDRDYMYRVYAEDPEMRLNLGIRRRLAPLLGNDRRQIELLNSLLLSLPGTPVLYYGDEIGMGDNVYVGDRNGVRTPMQWSPDRNAGFSRANPHRLYLPLIVDSEYHYNTVNVEAQRANPNSLLNSMKRLIATRKRFQALGLGDFHLLHSDNRKVIAFIRTYGDEQILVVANLSRFVQTVRLDLGSLQGRVPVEISGRTEFPEITDTPYFLSIGPYAFYWFTLKLQPDSLASSPPVDIPTLVVGDAWPSVFSQPDLKGKLESWLPDYLCQFHWFGGRTRTVQTATITETIAIPYKNRQAFMVRLHVDYIQGDPQTYWLYLSYARDENAIQLLTETPQAVVARLRTTGSDNVAVLFDAIADRCFLVAILEATAHNQTYRGLSGELTVTATELFEPLSGGNLQVEPSPVTGRHSNTSIVYCDATRSGTSPQLILKLFRKAETGINPDLEIRRFLDRQHRFEHITSIAGYLEYHPSQAASITVGILQQYIADARNTWDYTLDSLRDYFEHVAMQPAEVAEVPVPSMPLLELQAVFDEDLPGDDSPARTPGETGTLLAAATHYGTDPSEGVAARLFASHRIGSYLANVQLLGQRTAELHVALASDPEDPDFAPEPFTSFYQRSIYQYSRNLVGQVFLLLKERLNSLLPDEKPLAQIVLNHHQDYLERFRLILDQKITALRTRYHGDYHLGQILYTGKDFFIIDFEGESTRNVNERRMKRSPLRDVAGMLQSFYYAASYALQNEVENGFIHADQFLRMEQWAQLWESWVSAAFLNAYLKTARQDSFLPENHQELKVLLDNYLLERAVYDLGYKLLHRSESIQIQLQRVLQFQTL